MRNALLIPLGAGIFSALLHLSVTAGSPMAFMLAYFAQAPVAAVGLSLGFMNSAVAAAFAAILVLIGSPGVGALSLYLLTSALPVLVIVYFAVQNRGDQDGNTSWYPLGHLLGWLTALGLAAFTTALIAFMFGDGGLRVAIENFLRSMFTGIQGVDTARIDRFIETSARIFPTIAAASWVLMNIVNCSLAQRLVTAAEKNIRPIPSYRDIEAPLWPLATAVLGGILLFLGGEIGFFALNILLISTIPFFFIGLAVLHSISAAWPGRPFLLAGAYIFLVLAHWPAALLVALGTLEPWLRLREKANARHSNKGNE